MIALAVVVGLGILVLLLCSHSPRRTTRWYTDEGKCNNQWSDADTGAACPLCMPSRAELSGYQPTYSTQEQQDSYTAAVAARSNFSGQEERDGTLAETHWGGWFEPETEQMTESER
jgi:hypothetical protein